MRVIRYDRGTLRPARRLDNGMIVVDGLLTRAGVFEYLNSDGTMRKEYRPDEEVFNKESMDSFAMIPFVDGHPPDGLLTAKNAKKYAVGALDSNVRQDGEYLAGTIAVYDQDVIDKMEHGTRELSCGYEIELDETPGVTPTGERYDVVQRKIRGNHVALVSHGRAGETACVRMDAAMQQPIKENYEMKPTEEELKKAMEAAQGRASAAESRVLELETQLKESQTRADKAEGELESVRVDLAKLKQLREDEKPEQKDAIIAGLKSELAAAKKARADQAATFDSKLQDAVKARVKLEAGASLVLRDVERFDSYSDREIMVEVVKKLHGVVIDDDKSMDYVQARYDGAMEGFTIGAKAINSLRNVVSENEKERQDARISPRQAMIERNRNAWKSQKEA